jgi:copper(I)-binding protein
MPPTIRTRTLAASIAAVLALGGLAACGSDSDTTASDTTAAKGELTVTDVWARESPMSAEFGAVYFVITNGTDTEDELVSASVPASVAGEAQIHETVAATDDTDMSTDTSEAASSTRATIGLVHEDTDTTMAGGMSTDTTMAGEGMMTMREVESVAIPAGGTVAFEPGGYHVMLMDLAEPLEAGTTVEVTLTFANAGEIKVSAEVRSS